MHTFTASDGTVFLYNPDLSDVRVNVPNDAIEDISYLNDTTTAEPISQVQISGPALREFILNNIRDGIVSELENFDLAKLFK